MNRLMSRREKPARGRSSRGSRSIPLRERVASPRRSNMRTKDRSPPTTGSNMSQLVANSSHRFRHNQLRKGPNRQRSLRLTGENQ